MLGTKADAARDHIRVDGKLLQGAERLRYFVLNKPRGFVTTVKDPEGRPTVMQFFDKMRERLYPVGRLDYMSEGLLLVTNDGELANRLTSAASGVEKTYLVKVAGQPTEAELDILRGGVTIDRGRARLGARSAPLRPASARSARATIPGTKSFSSRAATANCARCSRRSATSSKRSAASATARWSSTRSRATCASWSRKSWNCLRKAADGKLRTPKSKEIRRRNLAAAQLPTLPPRPTARRARPSPSKAAPKLIPRITARRSLSTRPSRTAPQVENSAHPAHPARTSAAAVEPDVQPEAGRPSWSSARTLCRGISRLGSHQPSPHKPRQATRRPPLWR